MKQPDVPKQPRCAVIAAALLLAAGDGRVVEYTARGAAGGFKNGSIATSRSGANEPHSPYLMIHPCGRVLTSSQPG